MSICSERVIEIKTPSHRLIKLTIFPLLILLSTFTVSFSQNNTDNRPSITARRALTPINVDGQLEEQVWSLVSMVNKTTAGTPNNSTNFGILWDADYLYISIRVLDQDLQHDSPDPSNDDSVAVYIDTDNNQNNSSSRDRYFVKGYSDPKLYERGENLNGVLHSAKDIVGGYTVSLAIPWSNLGVLPMAGTEIGIDIANNDDDNGADRDNQQVWVGAAANGSQTSQTALLTLVGETVGAPLPSTPSNLRVIAEPPAKIIVTWTDNSTDEDGFKVERSSDGKTFNQLGTIEKNVTTFEDRVGANVRYFYRVRAYNVIGNSDYSNIDSVTLFPPVPPVTIPLGMGWNLISLPLRPAQTEIEEVLSSIKGKYRAIFRWDNPEGRYQTYAPGAASNTLTSLVPGVGYWIYMTAPENLIIAGQPLSSPTALFKGWNLVGVNHVREIPVNQATASISEQLVSVYGFNNATGNYQTYEPSSGTLDLLTLKPGAGYWIYVNENITWTID
jgi:hypothetical protein